MKAKKTEGAIAGVFITLEEKWWTLEMRKVVRQAGKFKHHQSATQYPRLQHWYIKQNDDKLQDSDAMWEGFPIFPELSHPLSGKEPAIKSNLYFGIGAKTKTKMSNKHSILTHYESWHTLPEWIERARATMGDTDLNPASNAQTNKIVKATSFFDAGSNGLTQQWFGRVFLNPPYPRGSQRIPHLQKYPPLFYEH